eukprot:jgi/Botrbrau1/11200/Bobra.0214s0024.1
MKGCARHSRALEKEGDPLGFFTSRRTICAIYTTHLASRQKLQPLKKFDKMPGLPNPPIPHAVATAYLWQNSIS